MKHQIIMWGRAGALAISAIAACPAKAAIDVVAVINNMENNDKQSVLAGHIDSLTINQGNAEFHFGPGEATLLDFGSGRSEAMIFKGSGTFCYSPPNDTERRQLKRHTGFDTLQHPITQCVLFSGRNNIYPDSAGFVRETISKEVWNATQHALSSCSKVSKVPLSIRFIMEFTAAVGDGFLWSFIILPKTDTLIFANDAIEDDLYSLYRSAPKPKDAFDCINGYSPGNKNARERGALPIDLLGYSMESQIGGGGQMTVNCQIDFSPCRDSMRFVYFIWSQKNKLLSAKDDQERPLIVLSSPNEKGFGLLMNDFLGAGAARSVSIQYESKCLDKVWEGLYLGQSGSWYPLNIIPDMAEYEIEYTYPKGLKLLSVGRNTECASKDGKSTSKWTSYYPSVDLAFCLNEFDTLQVATDNPKPLIYLPKSPEAYWLILGRHSNDPMQHVYESILEDVQKEIWREQSVRQLQHILPYYTALYDTLPCDTVLMTDIPYSPAPRTAGLIINAAEKIEGSYPRIWSSAQIARSIAYQWWGAQVGFESYRDEWIIEGISEFSRLLTVQADRELINYRDSVLVWWQNNIFKVSDTCAISPILGNRLSGSNIDCYHEGVRLKGAYVFQMLRYLLYDYNFRSEQPFVDFCHALFARFKGGSVTTNALEDFTSQYFNTNMSWFFDQWVYGTEIPEYTVSRRAEQTPEGKYKIILHVKEAGVPDSFKMAFPVRLVFDEIPPALVQAWVDRPVMDIELGVKSYKPKQVIFNAGEAVLCKVKYE